MDKERTEEEAQVGVHTYLGEKREEERKDMCDKVSSNKSKLGYLSIALSVLSFILISIFMVNTKRSNDIVLALVSLLPLISIMIGAISLSKKDKTGEIGIALGAIAIIFSIFLQMIT